MRIALFAVGGLLFGSFLTVVIHRVPREESIVAPRSRCPRCGAELRARDNVPVVSYLLLRGRCRACGERISPEYPLTEAATAALFAATGAVVRPLFAAILVAPFLGLMLAIALIDARWQIVPNRIMYPAFLLYVVLVVSGHVAGQGVDAVRGGIGVLVYAGPIFILSLAVPSGMGMGDAKLAALIGLVLGSLGLGYVAVAAFAGLVGGGVGGIGAMVFLGYGRKQHIPFGPFLAGGAACAALAAPRLIDLYLSLLGAR